MIIGVDLDGVCGDYIAALKEYVGAALGVPVEKIENIYPNPSTYDMKEWPDFERNFVKYHADAVEKGIYKTMNMIPKASETLWKLSDEGFHLRVITSRFVKHRQNQRVVGDTAYWLDKNDIPYRDLMFVRDKADVWADVYIDDSPENIHKLTAAGREVIIFDATYNQDLIGRRAKNWDEVYAYVQEIAAASGKMVE